MNQSKNGDDAPILSALDVFEMAISYLARRDHAEGELREKLRRKSVDDALIDEAFADLRERDYLNDARFAELQGAILARKGWGPMQIAHKLSARGINQALIAESLAMIEQETSWFELCQKRFEAKFGALARLTPKERQKAYRYLTHRGFAGAVIRQVIFA
ncbi:MAG: regulatory protein RecX [Bradymonadaceae bacterium]|nr:regulatory protein RecX [Lujinxingiaceae bacterium]